MIDISVIILSAKRIYAPWNLEVKAPVLPGVTVHEGGVVGCVAVVIKDVEPWTVAGAIRRSSSRGAS